MYRKYESDKDEEEVEGTVIGGGDDYISDMRIVYLRSKVNVLSLGSFSSVGSSSQTSHPSLPLSFGVHRI